MNGPAALRGRQADRLAGINGFDDLRGYAVGH